MRYLPAFALALVAPLFAACHAAKAPPAAADHEAGSAAQVGSNPGSAHASPSDQAAQIETVSKTVLGDMDRAVDPCKDFYEYACGSWLARTRIPADKPEWGRGFSEIEKRNEGILRGILEKAVTSPGSDSELAKLGVYYGACMDEERIERAGVKPLRPMLDRIEAVGNAAGLMEVVGELQRAGDRVLFSTEVDADFKDPGISILYLNQGGLGLFDRDYYLKDDEEAKGLRKEYEDHVARMLALLGEGETGSKKQAGQVLAFETELAKISRPRAELRDPDKNYNRVDVAGLKTLAPGIRWDAYLAAIGYPALTQISVGQPPFFEGLSTLAGRTDAETLRAYLRWHLVHGAAPALSRALVDENFRFYGATLSGQKEIEPRWKRCVSATDDALGESVGRYFVKEAFPGDSKTMALDLIQRIESAFRVNVEDLSWMDAETRSRALKKLDTLANKIGYPDAWRDYSGLSLEKGNYFANETAASVFEFKRVMDKVGKPVDRKEWIMTPPMVNAYYNPLSNEMVFPAGILQAPFFRYDFPAPMNFGGIGLVMGHELTHGYDDEGRKFDPSGRLAEWWAPGAAEKFETQAACVTDLYSSFEVQPGVHLNGTLTLGENIADFGGVKAAYQAWRSWEADHGKAAHGVEGLSSDQLFFVAFAQSWCDKITPEYERLLVNLDSHSPSKYRVNGPLSNFPAFGEAFSCKVGDPMRPAKICTVW